MCVRERKIERKRVRLSDSTIKGYNNQIKTLSVLTSTIFIAMPYPTTKAAKSRMYGEPDKNFIDSPALIFVLLFLPGYKHAMRIRVLMGVVKENSACGWNRDLIRDADR